MRVPLYLTEFFGPSLLISASFADPFAAELIDRQEVNTHG